MRISDEVLENVCEIIIKTDGLPEGDLGMMGNALRAAALDLRDARAENRALREAMPDPKMLRHCADATDWPDDNRELRTMA